MQHSDIVDLGHRLRILPKSPILFSGVEADVEYVAHELCHAVSLGVPVSLEQNPCAQFWGDALPQLIEKKIDALDDYDQGAYNEALCLAAERELLRYLGIAVTEADLLKVAGDQGVTVETCRHFGTRKAHRLARQVMRRLLRLQQEMKQ